MVAEGPPPSLRGRADGVRVEVDDPSRAVRVVTSLPGVAVDGASVDDRSLRIALADGTSAADVNEVLVRAGMRVHALEPVRSSLEDIFLELTEGIDVPR
jgi:ABC-2 type transport system ATP-binding protein